jgi:molybdate transport system substrate-binding protein
MHHRRRSASRLAALAAAALIAFAGALPAGSQESGPVVFAAASLKNALDDVNAAWKAETGKSAVISYAASSALARQIEGGAPADVFFSADLTWMDYLADRKLIRADSRAELLGNSIVLVAPTDSAVTAVVGKDFPLKDLLAGGKLAMGAVDSVPAGRYGKAALEKLGVWGQVRDDVAQAENVRAALLLVSRAEAPLGIVYRTDAAADAGVKVVGAFPADSHPAIVYPVALTAESAHPDAAAFVAYLSTDAAKALFEKQGFTVLGK